MLIKVRLVFICSSFISNSSAKPVDWLMIQKYLIAGVCIAIALTFSFLIIIAAWVGPTIKGQNDKIALIQEWLEQQMKTSDGKILEEFKWLEGNTTAEITELKSTMKTMQERLDTTELALHHEKLKNSELERKIDDNRRELTEMEETLREKGDLLNGAIVRVEQQQTRTTNRVSTLEESYHNTTSLLQSSVGGLEEELTNTTTRTAAIEWELRSVESNIDFLNITKANAERVNSQVEKLERDKVDRSEFEVLSANLSLLAEASSTAHEEIQQELNELADSALNETHYHELHEAIASKASQTDLEALAISTVRTEIFLQRVESIQNTILQLQWNITFNLSHLEGRIDTLNSALSTKADQQDVSTLSTRVQEVRSSVEDIEGNKADKSELNRLQTKVRYLEGHVAIRSDLSHLEQKLSDHSSNSDGVHSWLSSSITSNRDSISDNADKISELESSSSGQTLSQSAFIAVSVSVTLILCWVSY